MESLDDPSSKSGDESFDCTPAPDTSRHTSHTGNQNGLSGLGYGFGVAWHHLRPFLPFFLISFMVVALVYLMQAIIYGGPFKDPLFFVKFNERWPRPTPLQKDYPSPTKVFSPVPSPTFEQVLTDLLRVNETAWHLEKLFLFFVNARKYHTRGEKTDIWLVDIWWPLHKTLIALTL